jgi:hypothetical protein
MGLVLAFIEADMALPGQWRPGNHGNAAGDRPVEADAPIEERSGIGA